MSEHRIEFERRRNAMNEPKTLYAPHDPTHDEQTRDGRCVRCLVSEVQRLDAENEQLRAQVAAVPAPDALRAALEPFVRAYCEDRASHDGATLFGIAARLTLADFLRAEAVVATALRGPEPEEASPFLVQYVAGLLEGAIWAERPGETNYCPRPELIEAWAAEIAPRIESYVRAVHVGAAPGGPETP